ncbi:alpha-2-macroglobulin [Pseudoduganella sp. GCM10020061]|uniref:alpha-2-macroglobulin family protein n=1 Tax=Pseudoduganella sp. GCM10020061 TaxID=3317345 RepID=UPI003634BCC4
MRAPTLLLALACLATASAPAFGQAAVESFSPTGTVKKVRQATARFSADMVPLGTLAQPDPFTVSCPTAGQGRWIDTRNWSYDFTEDLAAGQRCSFTLRAGLRDLGGRPVAGAVYAFDTGGPAVMQSQPSEGWQVDEDQVFLLGLDGDATPASVAAHAWCKAEGVNERIGVRVLGGAERGRMLAAHRYFVRQFAPEGKAPDDRVVALQCQRTLPAGARMQLVWGAGIAGQSGVATTQAQELAFRTRPDFSATFGCQRMAPKAGCIPFLPLSLSFSAPVERAALAAVTLRGADGKAYPAVQEREQDDANTVDGITFKGPFPPDATLTLSLPPGLADDAGRALVNAASFPMQVRTGPYPPLVKFPARFGILEARANPMLPVTVRAVERPLAARVAGAGIEGAVVRASEEQVIGWLEKLSYPGSWSPRELYLEEMKKPLLPKSVATRQITLPRRQGAGMEVIGIPLARPGFYVVEIASPMLGEALAGEKRSAYVSAAALVTNMVAHFKRGGRSSVVWVTSLDKGRPVPGAQVTVRGCKAKPLWTGRTDANGIARIAQELPSGCRGGERLFVSATLGEDMTFTLSSWNDGIEPYRFGVNTASLTDDDTIAATVFDRMLLRTGETVHMKHFLRKHTMRGVEAVAAGDRRRPDAYGWRASELKVADQSARPAKAWIVHQGTDEKFELPLQWDANAVAAGEWKVPDGAKLGTYEVFVGGRVSGSFRVEQFRVPLMKGSVQGPRAAQVAPASLPLDLQLNYLAGGGASFAPVTVRTTVTPRSVSFPGYEAFAFAAEEVRESAATSATTFQEEGYEEEEGAGAAPDVRTRQAVLDKAGGARVTIDQLPAVQTPGSLVAEMSYQDPNGEVQTVSQRVALWPASVTLGLRQDDWVAKQDALRFQAVVLDLDGKPVAGSRVTIELFQRTTYTHRKRLVGGLYSYQHTAQVRKVAQACEGVTDDKGLLECTVASPAQGNVIVQARTADAQGRAVFASRDVWLAGGDEQWFDVSDSDRIDLLPLQKRYEPGQRATFQVRSPFREATALVTVEREGVMDSYVRRLRGKDPTFTIPVKPGYAPNVFVSALVVRGRVAGIQPTALVDLGKPAYKLGIARVQVGWAAHELKVQVSADKEVYKVREKAAVRVRVARADGKRLPAGAEIALAAVDTGLLELMPNTSWNLLEAMMQERSLQVETSTAQMQVVGKRHFGRKALPPGGGGGRGAGRELFDTLLFWKARVALDANGEASVQVPLNDSLTSFRIVAIASAGEGLFGTGAAEVRSSQDLMLLSGLPQLVREGDRARANFTVRNASGGSMSARVAASVAADGGAPSVLPAQQVTLEAGQAREIGWDYSVPAGAKSLAWQAEAVSGQARDLLRTKQEVGSAVPVRTLQATLVRVDRPLALPVQAPAGALPGRGGIAVRFTPRLASAMPGVIEYMQAYSYTCFEQRASRAVALRDRKAWDVLMAALPAHLDGDGLVKYFTLMERGSDTLTAYVLSVAHEAGYDIPAALRERMVQGLTGFVRGTLVRHGPLRTADLAVRKVGALEALSRSQPVGADLLGSFDVAPNLWPTAALIDWYLVLKRSPGLPERDTRLAQAGQVLRARLNLQGTTLGFSTERSDDWWWLMMSSDANANRLLLAMLDNPAWREDMGRLARGALGRQRKGRWDTTVANAWGVLAMEKFSARFESIPVTGASAARLGASTATVGMPAPEGQDTARFAWPAGVQQLGLAHSGAGAPWATVQSLAAVPLAAPLSSGYRIVRTVTPVDRKEPGKWSRGDVYRVRLDLEAQADMTWVVVDDPIPAGATVLGSGLGGDSQIQSAGERQRGWVIPAFRERAHTGLRTYYEFVPKGKWSLEYTVRLNNAGQFVLPPTHVEAMYNPEMFGDLPNAPMTVAQ